LWFWIAGMNPAMTSFASNAVGSERIFQGQSNVLLQILY